MFNIRHKTIQQQNRKWLISLIFKDHIIIDKKNNKLPLEKLVKDKNRKFTEETQIVMFIWKNIQCYCSQ